MLTDQTTGVLVVSSSSKVTDYILQLLPGRQFAPVVSASDAGEARRMLVDGSYDLILINSPLPDEFGTQLALDIAENHPSSGILLFVKAEMFEQVAAGVEDAGVLTMARPGSRQSIYQAVKLLMATRNKLRRLEEKAQSLEVKMKEIRQVNRAKWMLVERLKMTEPEAHRYIEKTAMDRCVKRLEIAESIIRTYGS